MLTRSAQHALRSVKYELSHALVSEMAQFGLTNLVAVLPELGGAHYLECRLGQRAPSPVDFLVAITKVQRDAVGAELAASARRFEGLVPFAQLLDRWTQVGSPLHEAVPVAWLEFDDVEQQLTPSASVCVSVVPSYIDPYAPLTSLGPTELLATLHEAVAVVRGTPCDAREQAALAECVARLPSGAHWIHLSIMTARKPVELKLYGAFPQHSLVHYLREIGWRGDLAAIADALARYCPPSRTGSTVYIDLPLTQLIEGGPCGLGLCFSQQQVRTSGEADPARRALLTQLTADGLCSPDEAAAVGGWARIDERNIGGIPTRIKRWSDVKLVHRPDGSLLAKAYLGFATKPPSNLLRHVPRTLAPVPSQHLRGFPRTT